MNTDRVTADCNLPNIQTAADIFKYVDLKSIPENNYLSWFDLTTEQRSDRVVVWLDWKDTKLQKKTYCINVRCTENPKILELWVEKKTGKKKTLTMGNHTHSIGNDNKPVEKFIELIRLAESKIDEKETL